MRCRRVVAQAPCNRANQECSMIFTWPMRSPSTRSRAPLTASGTAASLPARMRTLRLCVYPPHARAEAQASWLPGTDVLGEQRHLLILQEALHQGDYAVISGACLRRIRQMHDDARLQIAGAWGGLAQRLQAAIEQQQLGGECRIGDVSGLVALHDATQVQQRARLLSGVVQAKRDGRGQFGDQQGTAERDLETIRCHM